MTAQLYTQCRGCGEIFSLTTEALTCAYGRVRCSVCGTVFNALDTLTDHPSEGDLPLHDIDNAPPLLQHPEDPDDTVVPASGHADERAGADTVTPVAANESVIPAALPEETTKAGAFAGEHWRSHDEPEEQPEYIKTGENLESRETLDEAETSEDFPHPDSDDSAVAAYWPCSSEHDAAHGLRPAAGSALDQTHTETAGTGDLFEPLTEPAHDLSPPALAGAEETRRSNWNRWWGLAAVLMLAGLLWQAATGLREGRIALPDSTWANSLCDALDCPGQAAAVLDLSRIATVSSSIRPHPGRDDSLIVSTTFMNTAKHPMPFPALQVTLADLDGKPVALRRFLPHEYLPENLRQAQMLPQTLIPVTLEILKPEGQANAFQIEFSQPGGATEP